MDLTPQNVVAWHDQTPAQHKIKRDDFSAKGYRSISLSVYGTVANPLIAAVMVKRPVLIATKQFGPLNQAGMQQKFEEMADQQFGPYILTATGPSGSAVFLGAFRHMVNIPLTRLNLTATQFQELNAEQKEKGRILMWVDAFGTALDTRYTAIWGPNPSGEAWACDGINDPQPHYKARFDALTSTWCRQRLVSVTPMNGYLSMFVDSTGGAWSARANLSPADFTVESDKAKAVGQMPVCISGSGSGSSRRIGAIFADRDDSDTRVFRSNGPVTVASIDSVMESYVKDHNLRGAALAITVGTRLVYCKGFTHAEKSPTYPDVLPTTLFRQASVSKVFCAVAMWRLIQQGTGGVTLNTKMQSILNLKQPDGSDPKDGRFADIRIRHLLESTSGIKQGWIWWVKEAAEEFGQSLPATHDQLARFAASKDLTGEPGDPNNVSYGNFDYFLLSLVVAKLAGSSSFEAALSELVLKPLGMASTRGSRTLVSKQASDEARHHLRVHEPKKGWPLFALQTGASVKEPGKTVAAQYGSWDYELLDGCGGLSSSVVDVARLVAMFSDRNNNPVLKASTLDAMFSEAVNATAGLDTPDTPDPDDKEAPHGFHGFDAVVAVDAANHSFRASKGGWLPGQATEVIFRSGGYGYVLAQNGNVAPGVTTGWLTGVNDAAKSHQWGIKDLFQDFGMAALSPVIVLGAAQEDSIGPASREPITFKVADSMARQVRHRPKG